MVRPTADAACGTFVACEDVGAPTASGAEAVARRSASTSVWGQSSPEENRRVQSSSDVTMRTPGDLLHVDESPFFSRGKNTRRNPLLPSDVRSRTGPNQPDALSTNQP